MKFVPTLPALAAALLSLWSPASATAQGDERTVLSQLYGDLALKVRTRGQGSLNIGVADANTSLVVTIMSIDLRRWSDSATRVLAARLPRRGSYVKWEAVVEGPGTVSGSMSLARSILPNDTSLVLLVTDTAFRAVRTELTPEEARALTVAMKRAALASLPTRVPPPPTATKAPPTKAPLPKKPPA